MVLVSLSFGKNLKIRVCFMKVNSVSHLLMELEDLLIEDRIIMRDNFKMDCIMVLESMLQKMI